MKTSEIVEKYISSDSQSQQQIEQEVGQSYTTLSSLLGFMSECAVLAVRQKDKLFIEKGLFANVVEGSRQDFRDNIVQLTKHIHFLYTKSNKLSTPGNRSQVKPSPYLAPITLPNSRERAVMLSKKSAEAI